VGTFANSTLSSPFSSVFPDADGWVNVGGQDFAVNYSADFTGGTVTGGNDVLLRAVPEPTTIALLGAFAGIACLRRRRR
jgi:hypothetical protein